MPLAWVTDLHFEQATAPDAVERLVDAWNASSASAVICTGDICEGERLLPTLARIDARLTKPFYFVLGNHDFYDGAVDPVRRAAAELARRSRFLRYLTDEGPILLAPGLALIGDDGWSDGRVGDFLASGVTMRDYERIADLTGIDDRTRADVLARFGTEAAERLRGKLAAAFDLAPAVIAATHVPPFREACRYKGHIADDVWAPHFVCGAIGEMLLETLASRPDRRVETLCGHSHSYGAHRPLPNLFVNAGAACYHDPGMTRLLPT